MFRVSLLAAVVIFGQCLAAHAQSTTPPVYRNLVMEGGGIRGVAYGGALEELARQGVLDSVKRVGGTSAGAIQAALLAVGYSPQEIVKVVNTTPIQRFNDGRFMFLGGSHRLMKQYGWYRGDALTDHLMQLVARKTNRPELTLLELHELAQQQPGRFRDLYTTGTNLTQQRIQVFSYETNPTMRVADAVRISMSIPLYFRAVLLDAQNNVIHGKPAKGQPVQVLVDGGLLANYPVELFDYPRYLPPRLQASATSDTEGRVFNPETLGLRLDRAEQIACDTLPTGRQQLAPYDINGFSSYVAALYNLTEETLNRTHPQDWRRTISINTEGFSPKIKRMSESDKQRLMSSGRRGVQAFFGSKEAKTR
ncbi:patatin-like phospholipase family protein [Hymenobacter sp. HSC-4F20]|uniref:patatin-like phospholipase family protein n=1 Tax=Hymenobacter sp. HSC-4F20 TaxID=2864135 RepID=UPI001C73DEAA|nr:patatin-like phospholipase family protein [Hymenobacter sp. HSC-4F20]MBX0291562.1 patatin-like phospholipase family protein [Hymenobacter sp. HSC-4F20]